MKAKEGLLLISAALITGCNPLSDATTIENLINKCQYESHTAFATSPLTGWSRLAAREQLTNACLLRSGLRENAESEFARGNCVVLPSTENQKLFPGTIFRLNTPLCWAK
jgi:hypothetical protein